MGNSVADSPAELLYGETNGRLERERAFHNERFADETRHRQGKFYAAIKHGILDFEARVRDLASSADVLEYGCGAAIQGLRIARTAKSVTGIDISDVAIAEASAAASRLNIQNTRYVRMNAEDLTFPEASFDLIFGRGIIHHLNLD